MLHDRSPVAAPPCSRTTARCRMQKGRPVLGCPLLRGASACGGYALARTHTLYASGPKIEPKRQLMPTFAVWMSGKSWLKQNGPPATTAPEANVAVPQLVRSWPPSPMNMYSAFRLQLGAKAHSMPPPIVPTVAVSSAPVAISQLPQPAGTEAQVSTTEALIGTNAAPPFT